MYRGWLKDSAMRIFHTRTPEETGTKIRMTEKWSQQEKLATMESSLIGGINPSPELTTYNIKLGWIQGVLIPCLLNIWGVMLFLRIAWVVAQAGVGLTLLIIFLSGVVCVTTTLSLSAICTNGVVEGGGVYYLVSRSLGAELGASVGIIFAFANAVAASMNTIGFCESLNELLKSHNAKIFDNAHNDIRLVGAIALLVMCIICAIGMDWETKAQNFLIITIVVAIVNYIVGSVIGPRNDRARAEGFVGINLATATQNWSPDYRYSAGSHHDFFSVFAMYFPAVTGVQAGANICGDLKNPASAIPKGTLAALGISTVGYVVMALLCGTGALRDASGNTAQLYSDACKPNCAYGLHNSYQIMHLMSLWSPLIYAGCWAATLSTAMTNLLSVPRLIQALGKDKIYPGLIYFSKPFGRHGEPYRGYVLVFIVSLLFLLIADLNTIAPLITNFYLASYALINFCTFHAELTKHISWRPSFKYYHRWISLLGFLLCITMMVIISWKMAIATLIIFCLLYLLVLYREPAASWGSSTEASKFNETVSYLLARTRGTTSLKFYNPQPLVMAGKPHSHPVLLDVADLFTKIGSYMIAVDIEEKMLGDSERSLRQQAGVEWFKSKKYRAFYYLLDGMDFETGARVAIQTAGFGSLVPNIFAIGYKTDWQQKSPQSLQAYFNVLRLANRRELALLVMRVPNSRYPSVIAPKSVAPARSDDEVHLRIHRQVAEVLRSDSEDDDLPHLEPARVHAPDSRVPSRDDVRMSSVLRLHRPEQPRPPASSNVCLYAPMEFKADSLIDLWWLYDDGELSLLLSYIISQRGFHEKLQLRIFVQGKPFLSVPKTKEKMETLLKDFRIECKELVIVNTNDSPTQSTREYFEHIIEHFKTTNDSDGVTISENDLLVHNNKTTKNMRIRDLLLMYSSSSSLIIITMPMPRDNVPVALYMAWLDLYSDGLPPTLFVRGNGISVIVT